MAAPQLQARSARSLPPEPITVGLVLYPGCAPAGLFAAAEHFRVVNRCMGQPLFDPVWIGARDAASGLPAAAPLPLATAAQAPCEAYLLPGFWAETAVDIDVMLRRQRTLIDWLRAAAPPAGVWSYCMGVALAAAAGQLDGRAATATWWLEAPLRRRFPAVRWDCRHAVLADGPCLTAAGANGYWAVLSQLLLSRVPPEVAAEIDQRMLMPRANAGHPVFRPVELFAQADPELRRLIGHVQQLAASALTVDTAAAFLAMAPRTLSRKIAQQTQIGAAEWLRLIKLRQVAQALLASSAPVRAISSGLGFADDSTLVRAFKKATGMTTSQYRQQYGHALHSFAGAGELRPGS
ncbi:GlxA family transcriptional regulator [Massilia sp. SM-13]|uniref:GlxA family transcriptional regulator n=1 Tax=Pseudoduganella rhizocola TaxID=3382643 RepID=UPI0038B4B674